jgi:hypothetical protein
MARGSTSRSSRGASVVHALARRVGAVPAVGATIEWQLLSTTRSLRVV